MGGWNHKYLNAKSRLLIAHIRSCFEREFPGHKPFTGPVRVTVLALFAMTKTDMGRRWLSEHIATHETPYVKKPDADNIHKALDALTKIAWMDDSQIFDTRITKRYCLANEAPGTEIIIEHCPELVPERGKT
jgi:Holliday junction resolvase RusA-like endonuclease